MIDSSILSTITKTRNLLSISSHVTHGYVGNDAIQFPLNLRDWNVDCINTTNMSNHPGYLQFKGSKSDSQLIKDLHSGLTDLKIDYDAVIVGYTASKENAEAVLEILQRINSSSSTPSIIVLDPILGDNNKLYVSEDLIPVYKTILKQPGLVTLCTPNQFEMYTLTGVRITDFASLKVAVSLFFEIYKVEQLIITSVDLPAEEETYCVGATGPDRIFAFKVNQIDAVFSGSGDLFLGLLTDHFIKSKGDLFTSLVVTISTVSRVLQLTYDYSQAASFGQERRYINGKIYIPDLKLIESKSILLHQKEISHKEALELAIFL